MASRTIAIHADIYRAVRNPLRAVGYLLRRDPAAVCLVGAFVLATLFGGIIAPHSITLIDLPHRLEGPSSTFLVGTDEFGRDLLSRLLVAAAIAAQAALIVLLIGGLAGAVLGSVAGGVGGRVDTLISRTIELIQGFPVILLAIAIVGVLGPSLAHAMIAAGVGAVPAFARLARGIAIQMRSREFVEAARVSGASEFRIIWSELLPNMSGPLIVTASFYAAQAVMYEATLSFLGLGVQPPEPSFGGMLSEAKDYAFIDPLYGVVVGIPLAGIILGLNLLGDALSDYYSGGAER